MLITITLCLIILTACSTTTQADNKSILLVKLVEIIEMIVGGTFSPPTVIVFDNVDTDIDVISNLVYC